MGNLNFLQLTTTHVTWIQLLFKNMDLPKQQQQQMIF